MSNSLGGDDMDLTAIVKGVKLSKVCSIKPHAESEDSKQVTLEVSFDEVPLSAVFQKALSATVVTWQNSKGRKNFDVLRDKQVVKIDFKAPTKAPELPPEDAVVAKAKGMTPEERKAYIAEMEARLAELD